MGQGPSAMGSVWAQEMSSSIQGPLGERGHGVMGLGTGAQGRAQHFFALGISHGALGEVYLASPGNLLLGEPVDISFGTI